MITKICLQKVIFSIPLMQIKPHIVVKSASDNEQREQCYSMRYLPSLQQTGSGFEQFGEEVMIKA